MTSILSYLVDFLPLLVWFITCALSGYLLVRSLFNLNPREELPVGLAIGIIGQTWLANFTGRMIPLPGGSWLAALALFFVSFALAVYDSRNDVRSLFRIKIDFRFWLLFLIFVLVFWAMGLGMGILDEYPILPLISQMAAGDIPPHFALDPNVIYNYHYFSFLLSAQLMRLGDLFPWTALDLQQALLLTLSMFLLGMWVYRVTRSRWTGLGSALFYLFSAGTRWLLLLFPQGVLRLIDGSIQRMGSGLSSGEDLISALTSGWAARGTGPYLIPFAFANGFNSATGIGLGYITNYSLVFLVLLILTFNRWRDWKPILLYALLLAALELSNEVTYVIVLAGFAITVIVYWLRNRKFHLPRELVYLSIACAISLIFTLFQGGVISGVFQSWLNRAAQVVTVEGSFHDLSLTLMFPPAFVDAHLGVLSLFNPIQLVIFLVEVGPMLLLVWPLLIWGSKALRACRWMESVLAGIILVSLLLAFVQISLKASSIGSLTRAQNHFLLVVRMLAVPFLFLWLPKKGEKTKMIAAALLAITLFGGLIIIGLQLLAIQQPILTTYLENVDARIMKEFWNKLDPDYMVFDPEPIRAAVLFGKPTDAAIDWFTKKPEWELYFNNPTPQNLLEGGFGYLYMDRYYYQSLPEITTNSLQDDCVQTLAHIKDDMGMERYLLDVRGCQ